MRKNFFYPTLILLLFFAATGQAQNREILAELKIGIIGRDLEEAIYQAAHLGAQDAARELSKKYSIDVELLVATPSVSQGGNQPTSLTELFIQDVDGFVLSPKSQDIVESTVRFAQEQNQRVVFFESDLPDTNSLAALLADETAAGRLAGKAILKELPTAARVALLTSTEPSQQLKQRLEGLRRTLGYRRIEAIVATEPNYRDAIKKIREVEEADRNGSISGWVFLEDWPLRGMPALPWEPADKPVVAIQSSPSAFIYSDQGYLDALVVHPYYEWGYRGVETLVENLYNGKSPETREILTEPRLIDWRNFDDYREKWKLWFK